MAYINENFLKLQHRYLFAEIAKRVAAYKAENPQADIIRLGIGDVTQPLAPAVVEAMHRAVDECAHGETFRGYGPEHGYNFLIEAIIAHDFEPRGVHLTPDEVFISDGAKSDTGNIGDILSSANVIGVTDPVYPVYVDTNTMGGRDIRYIPCNEANGFTGDIPTEKLDVVYLCFPNNPTGAVITREGLQRWVDYALRNDCLILYDAAYEAFISDAAIPHSIYEIEGAKQCAIEFRSFSKTAGFTGVRCGYTIIPNELKVNSLSGERVTLNGVWDRRQCSKFNGASYISQRGAEAVFSTEGQKQIRATIDYYMANARIIRQSLQGFGLQVFGGQNAPYIWVRTPNGTDSWSFFDRLLREAQVVTTPGAGFGAAGEGYIRITAFGTHKSSIEAMERVRKCL
ncbi:MAG: LL-diaminopimelate aminotransferase [Salinivirgaceae bacterium]|nr:LL-diaminopimelate aminotransferase [Salinivirgaceae bacterium]